jgi:pilus assembly protein Flp/PilA
MIKSLRRLACSLARDQKAVTAIEYSLIAALVAVVIIGAVTNLGINETKTFGTVSAAIQPRTK